MGNESALINLESKITLAKGIDDHFVFIEIQQDLTYIALAIKCINNKVKVILDRRNTHDSELQKLGHKKIIVLSVIQTRSSFKNTSTTL